MHRQAQLYYHTVVATIINKTVYNSNTMSDDDYAAITAQDSYIEPTPTEPTVISGPADVGDVFPDFTLDSQVGPISYHALIDGKWGLVITFGKCYDPVTTTDIGMVCKLLEEYESRNISVVCIGTDTVSNYRKWIKDIEELQEVKVSIPLISDVDCIVLKAIGCAKLSPIQETVLPTCNGVFMIDVDKRVRSSMRYSQTTGRNFYEIIRLYDAMQLVTYHHVVAPSNWAIGQDVMVNNNISDDEANATLVKGFVAIKPWFRLTPAPDNK